MKKKNLVILCIVFAVLVSLVFFKKSVKPEIPTIEEDVAADVITLSVNVDDVTDVILKLGDGRSVDMDKPKKVHLAKEDGQWVVKTKYGVNANDRPITPILDKLDQLKGELRSNKKELLSDYGIADNEAVHIELRSRDAKVIRLAIGMKRSGFTNNFVRLGGTNAVYIVNENLLSLVGVRGEGEEQKLDVNKWVDKRIAHFDANDVVAITITEMKEGAEEKVIDLKRELVDDKKQWQSAKPYAFGLSASKIKSVAQAFSNIYAREVVGVQGQEVFDGAGWTGIFTLENGDQIKIVRGVKDTSRKNYYVKREGVEYVYLVPVSTFDSREKRQGNIFADNPLKIKKGDINELDVYDIANKKKFYVRRELPPETAEGTAEEVVEGQETEKEDVWKTTRNKMIETKEVHSVIGRIKSIKLEAVSSPASSFAHVLKIRIAGEGESKKYTISESIKLDNGKECHFLQIDGEGQSYCISKSQVTALQNTLP